MYTKSILTIILAFILFGQIYSQTLTNDNYRVKPGNGNGIHFWNGINYKIHMGNDAEYKYGPVSDFSIKMNMSNNPTRGWTWGVHGISPVAALNTQGLFQTKGWIKSMARTYFFGNVQQLYGDNASALFYRSNSSTFTQLIMRDKENKTYGKLIGSGDGANFGLVDGDNNWSYLAAKDNYTAFLINNNEKMRIKSNGNVGIGTNNPQKKLVVRGAAELGGASESRSLGIQDFNSSLTGVPGSTFGVKITGPLHSHVVFDIQGNDSNDGFYIRVPSTVKLNPTVNKTAFVVKANGRVGIGSTNPSGQLTVRTSINNQSGLESIHPRGNSHFPYSDGWSYLSGAGLIFRTNGNTERMRIKPTGKVVIGDISTPSNNYKLFVESGILTEKVRVAVKNSSDWADYVFDEDYELMPLEDVDAFVHKNQHLPGVPSAEEVVKDGIDMAQMDATLLEKIEELTLYVIQQQKDIEALKAQINKQ